MKRAERDDDSLLVCQRVLELLFPLKNYGNQQGVNGFHEND